jgi:hypothetical protein
MVVPKVLGGRGHALSFRRHVAVIQGQVVDFGPSYQPGPGVPDAIVRLPDYGISVRTDEQGRFSFPKLFVLHPCTYTTLVATAPGFGRFVSHFFFMFPAGTGEPVIELPRHGVYNDDGNPPSWDPDRTYCKRLSEVRLR